MKRTGAIMFNMDTKRKGALLRRMSGVYDYVFSYRDIFTEYSNGRIFGTVHTISIHISERNYMRAKKVLDKLWLERNILRVDRM